MVSIDFSVKEVAGISRAREIVALSIPFSRENSISETEELVVRDGGTAISVQREVLSRYEDGSVRRLLAIFPVDVEANQSREMVIERGEVEEASEILEIRSTDETITIASDLTTFRISQKSGAVESVLFRGEEILNAPLGPCFSNLCLEMEDAETVVEESGPYRARIVVKGLLKTVESFPYAVEGLGLLRGRVEITAYASSPRLDYTFRILKWGFGATQFGRMIRPEVPYSPGITVKVRDGVKAVVETREVGEIEEKALIPASNMHRGYASVQCKDNCATLVLPEVPSWGKGAVKVDVEDGEVTYWAAHQPAFIELNEGREISLKASLCLHPLSLDSKLEAEIVTEPLKIFIDPEWSWENLLEGAPGDSYAGKDAEVLKMARDMIVDKCFYTEGDLRGSLRNKPGKFGSVHGEVSLPREPVTEQDLSRLRRLLCEETGFYSRLEHAEYLLREFYRSGDGRLRDLALSWAERTVEYAIYRGWDENLYGSKPHTGSELQPPGAFVPYMMRGTKALTMAYEETGNRYFFEAAKDIVDFLIRNQSLVGTGHLGHISGSRVPAGVTQSREGYACRELIFFGLYTGEDKYIDAARRLGEALLKCQNPDGSWCMPYDVNGKPLPHPAIGYQGHALMVPYVLKGLLPLCAQFPEWEALRNGVSKALDWLISVQREDGSYGGYTKPVFYWHDPQCAEVLLDAYELFGDDRCLERAIKIKDMLGAIIKAYPESVMVPYAGDYRVLISWQVTNYPEIVYRSSLAGEPTT